MSLFIQPYRFTPINASYKNKNNNTFSQVSFKASGDSFDLDAREKELLDKRNKWQKFFGEGKEEARNQAIYELSGFNMNRASLEKQKDETIKAHEAALKAKDEALKLSQEKAEILEKKLEDAKKNNLKDDVIKGLNEKLKEAYSSNVDAHKDYIFEAEKLEKTKKEQEILTKRESGKGWNKMAGFEDIKTQLEEAFINKLALEKGGHGVTMPNSILFYGPKGTGKTRFAEAFAQQSKCNFISIDMMQDDDDILADLREAGKKAKKLYEKSGDDRKRTIILLDECDSIAKLNKDERKQLEKEGKGFYDETNVGTLKKFLSDCAEKYKCTVFMTTNYPLNIDSELFSDENTIPYQVFLGAPDKEDAAELFKYHMSGLTNQEINYDELAEETMNARKNNEAFSAGRIANIVECCRFEAEKTNQRITQMDLINKIRTMGPDHDSDTINRFVDEVNTMINRN